MVVAVTSKYQRCWLYMRHICSVMQVSLQNHLCNVCTCSMYRADTFDLPIHSFKTKRDTVCVPVHDAEVLFAVHYRLRLQFEGTHRLTYCLSRTYYTPAQLR